MAAGAARGRTAASLLAVIGAGCDGELTPAEVLERVAAAARAGAWIGHLEPLARDRRRGRRGGRRSTRPRPACSSPAAPAARPGPTPIRGGRRTVELTPVGALAFFFDPGPALADVAPLAAVVAGTDSIEDGARRARGQGCPHRARLGARTGVRRPMARQPCLNAGARQPRRILRHKPTGAAWKSRPREDRNASQCPPPDGIDRRHNRRGASDPNCRAGGPARTGRLPGRRRRWASATSSRRAPTVSSPPTEAFDFLANGTRPPHNNDQLDEYDDLVQASPTITPHGRRHLLQGRELRHRARRHRRRPTRPTATRRPPPHPRRSTAMTSRSPATTPTACPTSTAPTAPAPCSAPATWGPRTASSSWTSSAISAAPRCRNSSAARTSPPTGPTGAPPPTRRPSSRLSSTTPTSSAAPRAPRSSRTS